MHAIGSGILIIETQQSSDTTYRVYDFDRKDKEGKSRELHLDKTKEIIKIGNLKTNKFHYQQIDNVKIAQFISNEFLLYKNGN